MTFQPMETPLVISGFEPEAIRFWQQQTAGTALATICGRRSLRQAGRRMQLFRSRCRIRDAPALEPGSAVSMQLVRGDIEIAATCTVTYVDPKQLLACGHPVLGAGAVSLPMTAAEVVATIASPLNAFKVVNTGNTIGAFNEDRESAIRGVFGAQAHMIPMHIAIDAPTGPRKINVEILDLPSLTPLAMQVVLLQSLLRPTQIAKPLATTSPATSSWRVMVPCLSTYGLQQAPDSPAACRPFWRPASNSLGSTRTERARERSDLSTSTYRRFLSGSR